MTTDDWDDTDGPTDRNSGNLTDGTQGEDDAALGCSGTGLVRYDAMCKAIQAAHDIDEVKKFHDKARAYEIYSQLAKNRKAERQAREIRLRAERRAGELLREMGKAKGGRPTANRSHDATGLTLRQLGISRTQSSRWQQLAEVPEEEFEAAVAGGDATTTGIVETHLQHRNGPTTEVLDLNAGWLWRQLLEFDRRGLLATDPSDLLTRMPVQMKIETLERAAQVAAWLEWMSRPNVH
jgi:hypothetical protein